MKARFVVLAISTVAALVTTSRAQADDDLHDRALESHRHSLLYSCNMSFHASGRSIYIGLGYTELNGEGTLSCYDLGRGTTQQIPLKVTARGPGAGLGVTGLVLSGGATGIGISRGPEALLGRYLMVRANAAAGVGAGAGAGLHLSNGAATVDVTVQAQTGLGAGVDLLWVNIEAAEGSHREEARAQSTDVRSKEHMGHIESAPLGLAPATLPAAPAAAAGMALENTPVAPAMVQTASPNEPTTVQGSPLANTARTRVIPANSVTLRDGQPIELLDASGRVVQLIYVNRK